MLLFPSRQTHTCSLTCSLIITESLFTSFMLILHFFDAGLAGSTSLEQAQCHMLADTVEDMIQGIAFFLLFFLSLSFAVALAEIFKGVEGLRS